ncbi:hypothetical protein GCM10027614_77690 [Micromonospora vulcania]
MYPAGPNITALRGYAPVRVRGRIPGHAGVRLDLGDPDGDPAGVQRAAQQAARGRQQRAAEQLRQLGDGGVVTRHKPHDPTVPSLPLDHPADESHRHREVLQGSPVGHSRSETRAVAYRCNRCRRTARRHS